MFSIDYNSKNQTVYLHGKFDHSKANECKQIFGQIENSFTIDMSKLEFISSAGIGILVMTYSRLKQNGENIYLTNLNDHISKVFKLSLLDKVFNIV